MKLILFLEDIQPQDQGIVGGKAANLGELIQHGFPVPSGFVVTINAYQTQIRTICEEQNLADLNELAPEDRRARCQATRSGMSALSISSEISEAILTGYDRLASKYNHPVLCAVRSSATAEDSAEASFAGQHGTYYYATRDDLLLLIRHCWASLWNDEAVAYRINHGIPHLQVQMAVVVQEMIPSEVAGITFTANPVSGATNEIIIESSWGMGAAIVDGRVTPDRYVLDHSTLAITGQKTADKQFMISPRLIAGQRERLQSVPPGRRLQPTLSDDQAQQIAQLSRKAEKYFCAPQDVEWALVSGTFYLLQSRPITVMGRPDLSLGIRGRYVLFKPIFENFTEPLTPLTSDLLNMAAVGDMRIIKGWVYINISFVKRMLPLKLSDAEFVQLLFLGGDELLSRAKIDWPRIPLTMGFLLAFYLVCGTVCTRTDDLPVDFMDTVRDQCRRVEADCSYDPIETFKRLWLMPKWSDPIGRMVLFVNLSAGRYLLLVPLLRLLLQRWMPGLTDDLVSSVCAGTEGVLSAEMGRDSWRLAQMARENPAVMDIMSRYNQDEALARLEIEPEATIFRKNLNEFLSIYGHRGLKELELRSPRWEEQPAPVIGMIQNHIRAGVDLVEVHVS
ncbi:MAG: PEP/pyruvate-binding domain-containing protein [Desulfuromonadales bacterium]